MKALFLAARQRIARVLVLLGLLALTGTVAFAVGVELYVERHYGAATEALKRRDLAAASEHIQACLDLRPNRFRFQFLAAQTARRAGKFKEAGEHLTRCQELAGSKSDVSLLEQMMLRAQQGELADVEKILWKLVVDQHAEKVLILEALAQGYIKNYRLPHADKCLKLLLEEEPEYAEAWFLRAQICDLLGSHNETVRLYQRALDLEPGNDTRRLPLALYLVHANQGSEALAHLQLLHQRQPQNPDVLVGLAGYYLQEGNLSKGGKFLHQALALQPNHIKGLAEMGRLVLLEGNPDRAETWARKALAAEPSERSALYLLFQCLKQQGKKAEARQQQERLKSLEKDLVRLEYLVRSDLVNNPDNADAYCELGHIFSRQGHPERGILLYQHALRINSEHLPSHQALAQYYEQAGNADSSAWHRQKAKQIAARKTDS
jgi:tetratricopeptide (TPR) repeat protein